MCVKVDSRFLEYETEVIGIPTYLLPTEDEH